MCFKKSLFLLLVVIPFYSFALEIDEKLTMRILKVSSTQKTVLINRGIEDGLVVGDHARFFVPEGVIARAVSVKVSPTRSVWSVYRLVIPEYIRVDEVLSLKITKPVKLSDDPSRQVWRGEKETRIGSSEPRTGRISLAPGAKDNIENMDSEQGGLIDSDSQVDANDPELKELFSKKEIILNSPFEVLGAINFVNHSASTISDVQGSGEFSGGQQSIFLSLAGEYYFQNKKAWYSSVSVGPFIQFDIQQVFGARGTQAGTNFTDFGFMINVHPFKAKPWHVDRFIPYFNFSYGFSSASDSFNPGAEVATTVGTTGTAPGSFAGSGSGQVINFGAGVKTYLTSHWGIRALVSFESRSTSFTDDITQNTWTRSGAGLKITTSIGYRF